MLKLAHFITKSEIGGAQTWVKDQVALLEHDFEHFIITNKPGWLTDNVTVSSTLFSHGIEKKFSITAFLKMLFFVKSNNIDIIVASSANAGMYARLIRVFHRCRVIYVSHGWSCIYNGGKFKKLYVLIERVLSYLTDQILCVSENDRFDALNIIKVHREKLTYIRNCVFPRYAGICERGDDVFRIIFLGRLAHPKRPDLLIEAIKSLPNVQLDIVGDGPLKNRCQQFNNVKFIGAVDGFDGFNNYDLFALISDSEGMPMSALEAASAGVPILLSNVGGCSELIMGNGVLVDNDPVLIAQAIECVQKNYSTLKKEALRNRAKYDINNSYLKYKKLYSG